MFGDPLSRCTALLVTGLLTHIVSLWTLCGYSVYPAWPYVRPPDLRRAGGETARRVITCGRISGPFRGLCSWGETVGVPNRFACCRHRPWYWVPPCDWDSW